ncbi:MAG: transglutaminase-like domain-containing protein [Nanoarchaeota archaeon]
MVKKTILLLTLILFLPICFAQTHYSEYSSLNLEVSLDGEMTLNPTGPAPKLTKLTANLFLFPRETSYQEIVFLDILSNPQASIKKNGYATYEWTEYNPDYTYGFDSEIKVTNTLHKTPNAYFPIRNVPAEYEVYARSTEYIDITEDIIAQANEIVEGETNLQTATHKLGEWVYQNINYDLNTITAKAVKKSSWVLDNREGVCDEITNLFISFCRSVGIPARFVSGTVYSNLQEEGEGFGNHGWAEVYFPDYGWAPYDVTYGQFGWVDPSHVKLFESADSAEPSVKYNWVSHNYQLETEPIQITTNVTTEGSSVKKHFDLRIKALKNQVGPGSYVPIAVEIENPYENYLSDFVYIQKAPGLTEKNSRPVLIKPKQKKYTYWIAKIPNDASAGYTYTTLVEAKDGFGSSDSVEIEFSNIYNVFTKQEALDLVETLTEKEEKTYSEELSLICDPTRAYYYTYEDPKIDCKIKNIGNTYQGSINLCLEEDCRAFNLRISEEKEESFTLELDQTEQITINAKNSEIDLNNYITIKILENPNLRLATFNYPAEVNYNEEFNITILLSSEGKIQETSLKLNNLEPITIKPESTNVVSVNGKYFIDNQINLKIDYKDENGQEYSLEKTTKIIVNNLPWHIKIIKFFKNLF